MGGMKVDKILAYPIKSLRGVSLNEAILTKYGLNIDRRFLLAKVLEDAESPADWKIENMHLAVYSAMCLFTTALDYQYEADDLESATMTVTFNAAGDANPKSIEIPLTPDTTNLQTRRVAMHSAEADGYVMEQKYRDWFSECFGFDVVLLYLGDNTRPVLCSNNGRPTAQSNSWLSTFSSKLPKFLVGESEEYPDKVHAQDIVPYLIASETSKKELSSRLPEGVEMDITKLRPNIVVEGASKPWEEDYWAELMIGKSKIFASHNCGRCQTLNVNHEDGKFGTGPAGGALKTLMKDRRIDPGQKYSPIFGRYSFLDNKDHGNVVRVGDEVQVLKKNDFYTVLDFSGVIG